MSMIDELGTDETPSAKRQDEQEKEAQRAKAEVGKQAAAKAVKDILTASEGEEWTEEKHWKRMDKIVLQDKKDITDAVQKARKRGKALLEYEQALEWLERETNPNNRFILRSAPKVNDPSPERLLWHSEHDEAGFGKPGLLMRGELAILSGAGGTGKSRLAIQWGLQACGCDVGKTGILTKPGNVVFSDVRRSGGNGAPTN